MEIYARISTVLAVEDDSTKGLEDGLRRGESGAGGISESFRYGTTTSPACALTDSVDLMYRRDANEGKTGLEGVRRKLPP